MVDVRVEQVSVKNKIAPKKNDIKEELNQRVPK